MPKNKKSLFSFFFGSVLVIIAVYAGLLLVAPQPAQAQLLSNACLVTGNCRFCDVVSVAVRLGQFLIAGAGGLALVVVVWGAIGLVSSAGNPEKITAGKKQIVGAFFGMGITLVAFQLVAFVITLFAVPSALQTFAGGSTKEFGAAASLTNFLTVPWWSICNEKDLIKEKGEGKIAESGAPTTANCLFWGDGTQCKTDGSKCCRGACIPSENVCSYKKDIDILVDKDRGRELFGDELNEAALREKYKQAGIPINKDACPVGARYQDVEGGCTSINGMPAKVLTGLVQLEEDCGCDILVTGGTEAGHRSHGPTKPVVDLDKLSSSTYEGRNRADALSKYIYVNAHAYRHNDMYTRYIGPKYPDCQTYYYYVDGSTFLDECHHWHAVVGEEVSFGRGQAVSSD